MRCTTALRRLVALLLLAGILPAGCSRKETITQPLVLDNPHLVVTPDTLYIVDSLATARAYLSTDGPGTLDWRVTGKPAWITASPESGQVNQILRTVTLTGAHQGLAVGTHGGTVVFHSNGGEERVYVRFSVREHPLGSLSVANLAFAVGESYKTFNLTNQGTGILSFSIADSAAWLTVSPSSGYLGAGQSRAITASVNRAGLPPGTATAKLDVTWNSEGGPASIPVTMEVPSAPALATSPDSLRYDYFVNAASFVVRNTGNAPLTWNASASAGWVQLASTAGTLAAGDSAVVGATVDRGGLATGIHTGSITVTSGTLPSRTVGLRLKHFVETKWLLSEPLVDAEYSRALNRIVAVTGGSPARLVLIDPEARTLQGVTLPLTAACVAVRPDGQFAAAGHNGYLTYVNLSTMTVQGTFTTTADAIDIVLPQNGWCYVFPRIDQWESIRCVNLSTGAETTSAGYSIYAGTLARLHPSGDFIYGANNGLSPSDFEKYDIRSGVASVMYDSPYHGDYSFGGDIWISDDGLRLFARSGNVFRSSTVRAEDMTYNGSLSGASSLRWVEHSGAAGRVLACAGDTYSSTAPPEVRVYESTYLALRGTVPIPPFLVPNGQGGGTLYNSSVRYAFFNSAGSRVHVLARAPTSGLVNDWAVVSLDASALP